MAEHLTRRGGVWWARLAIPARLREAAGRREFIQSCRTSELHIAKLVCNVLVSKWRRLLLALESATMTADVLKLIDKSLALTAGGYLPLDDATTIVGLDRAQLLRLAEGGELRLHCRLIGVPGHIMDRADLELDASVTGGSAWIVPPPSQMSVSAIQTVHNGVLPIPDSTHVASAIIAGALETVDIVLFDLSSRPHQVFAPDSTVLCEVGRLELDSQQLEQVRGRLASDVTKEQLDRAREIRALTVSGLPAVKGKLFSEAVEEYCTDPSGLLHSVASYIEQRQRMSSSANKRPTPSR